MRVSRALRAALTGTLAVALSTLAGAPAPAAGPATPATTLAGTPAGTPAVATAPTVSAAPRAEAAGALRVSPRVFVGGQSLRFAGRLPGRGVRRVVLQRNGNRPGDSWNRVDGSGARTRRDGSFSFTHPAPAMFGISYRVVSRGTATRGVKLTARSQDLTLAVAGTSSPTRAPAGEPFRLVVDTTPTLQRRPDARGLPVFRGRPLTLQERGPGPDHAWTTVARSTVGPKGLGYFGGLTRPAGQTVFRVRQESITAGANAIGWYPSFPTTITVGGTARTARTAAESAGRESAAPAPEQGSAADLAPEARAAGAVAGSRYRWSPTLWDFTWEEGQSLGTPPPKGAQRRGRWEDWSNGTGRVSTLNGALALESGRVRGPGGDDRGSTAATLRGNARTYGRWEARMRARSSESGRGAYRIVAELVPASAQPGTCTDDVITIASISTRSRTLGFGVGTRDRRWRGSNPVGNTQYTAPAVAVEVTPSHITWFLAGRAIGTVRDRRAISDTPRTLRFRMIGSSERQMDQTLLVSDWQRGYPLDGGRKVTGGGALSSTAGGSC